MAAAAPYLEGLSSAWDHTDSNPAGWEGIVIELCRCLSTSRVRSQPRELNSRSEGKHTPRFESGSLPSASLMVKARRLLNNLRVSREYVQEIWIVALIHIVNVPESRLSNFLPG